MTEDNTSPSTPNPSSGQSGAIDVSGIESTFNRAVYYILGDEETDTTPAPSHDLSLYQLMLQNTMVSGQILASLQEAKQDCGFVDPGLIRRARGYLGTIKPGDTTPTPLDLTAKETEMAEGMFEWRMDLEELFHISESQAGHTCTCPSGERTPTARSFGLEHMFASETRPTQSLTDMMQVWYDRDRWRGGEGTAVERESTTRSSEVEA